MTEFVSKLLNSTRIKNATYTAHHLNAPWGVNISEHSYQTRLYAVSVGSMRIEFPDSSAPVQLNTGDIAIVPNGKAHSCTNKQNQGMTAAPFQTENECADFGREPHDPRLTRFLSGCCEMPIKAPPIITDNLPPVLIGRANNTVLAKKYTLVLDLIAAKLASASGQSSAALDRLTELLVIYAIEDWLDDTTAEDVVLLKLLCPKIKSVLESIHNDPNLPWNIENLAHLYGQSKSAFASHFKSTTGVGPMNYVRRCRIKLACQLLENNVLAVAEVAFNSGYVDTNAFSRAFKREIGLSPGAYKRMTQHSGLSNPRDEPHRT